MQEKLEKFIFHFHFFINIFNYFRDRSIVKWDYKSQDVLQEAEEKEELAKCKMDKSKRRRLSELQDLLFD